MSGLLRPLSRDDLELTEPSFFIPGWNEVTYLLGRFYSFTIGYKLHDSRFVNVFKNCHGILVLIPGHLLKIRDRVNGELVVPSSLV